MIFIFKYFCLFLLLGVKLSEGILRSREVDKAWHDQLKQIKNGLSIDFKVGSQGKTLFRSFSNFRKVLSTQSSPTVRKEYRCLNSTERSNLHQAFNKAKTTLVGANNQYDVFVSQHDSSQAPGAHFGPSFGPWHRHYLYLFEQVIKSHCPTCGLVYWDSRLDQRLGGNPRYSVLFSPQLAGTAVGPVTTGFAANWNAPPGACSRLSATLRRNFNNHVMNLYDDSSVNLAETATSHEAISFPWNLDFEYEHGYVHMAFGSGSHMSNILCSPTDPMFTMHHCFIDNLLERTRQNIKTNNPPLTYADLSTLPPGSDPTLPQYHGSSSPMLPFSGKINSDGLLDDLYTTSFYSYEKSPGDLACSQDSDCCANRNTEFVWCHPTLRQCISKIVLGGIINPNFPAKACYCSESNQRPFIQSGRCRCRTLSS